MNVVYVVLALCFVDFGRGESHLNSSTRLVDGERKCAEFNEYCQTNYDCCSRNCLSFSYKCIRERAQQPELQNNETPNRAPTAANVQELVDRFGADGSPGPAPPSFAGAAPPSISNPVPSRPIGSSNQPCKSQGTNCLTSQQCCSGQCSRITNICINGPEYFATNSAQSSQGTCGRHGDPCQADSECCSSNCLKFSYRCIRDRSNQADIQIVGGSPAPIAVNVDQLVDRFGATDGSSHPPTHGPPSSENYYGIEINNNNNNRPCRAQGDNCLTSSQCCSNQCSRITNMCINGPEYYTYFPHQPPSTPPSCRSIGAKCLRQEDCCSPLLCHDYWHHCVT